ncbi:hypothetical protein Cch01nite_35970 [Cellulomonas chitinilytica]|uniref:Methyltransferase domain-containing protein n=1 Tax=Cellulomonas chitinilytica TaxID=398759 RepID=A0A919P6I6_9CELL|nr:class I SAM-dependent methyltransferase [Cellulomonas chitinilytica]GIG22873.1 hypothetical protein Cch01nite_35970 [Cellulomonas chitinilytica]
MSRYSSVVDPSQPNSSQSLALELAGRGKDVLDVGCATGDLARALASRGCRVSGVEQDRAAADAARPDLVKLLVGDVATADLSAEFGEKSFDVLVFGDVLEHLADPETVLRSSLPVLRDEGDVILSIPNVAHGAVRLALLQGRWRTTETGLLDATHLRFFTLESIVDLLERAGLAVVELWATVIDPLESEVDIDASDLPPGVVDWVRGRESSSVYQYVVRARRGEPGAALPPLQLAVEPPAPSEPEPSLAERRQAAWDTERAELVAQVRALEHTLMVLRDEVIGAKAQAGTAQARAHLADVGRKEADERLDALLGSRSYRLGNAVMRPVSRVVRRSDS